MLRKLFALPFIMFTVFMAACSAEKSPQIIAHRGYWKAEGASQNSIAALKEAIAIGAYGSEFDVWVTSDGVAVINHDKDIQGKVIESSTYDDLKDLRLSNGEKIPTLKEYLSAGEGQKRTRLILELKKHSTKEANIRAAGIVFQEVSASKVTSMVEYITFDLDAGLEFIKLAPKAPVSYLNGDIPPQELKKKGFAGLDYNQKVYRENPQWISESRSLGLTVNVWTVNNEEDMLYFIGQGVDFITTDEPVLLRTVLDTAGK